MLFSDLLNTDAVIDTAIIVRCGGKIVNGRCLNYAGIVGMSDNDNDKSTD